MYNHNQSYINCKGLMTKINRNDTCPCGSEKKYKKCCALKEAQKKQKRFHNLKDLKMQIQSGVSSASPIASKVFSVLSSTMTPSKSALVGHSIKQTKEGHTHSDNCGCDHNHEKDVLKSEKEKAEVRGYSTLEELIGVENPSEKI